MKHAETYHKETTKQEGKKQSCHIYVMQTYVFTVHSLQQKLNCCLL